MKKLLSLMGVFLLFLFFITPGSGRIIEVPELDARMNVIMLGGSVPAGDGCSISDDFSSDPATDWTKLGDGTTWNWDSGNENVDIAGAVAIYDTCETSTVSQWVAAQNVTASGPAGVYFRSQNNELTYAYAVRWDNIWRFRYCGVNDAESCSDIAVSAAYSLDAGDYFGVEISGTGTSTLVKVYDFGGGGVPARVSWGTCVYGVYGTSIGSPSCSVENDQADPGQVANTGKYVGLYSGGASETFDDFSAGDI